MSTPQHESPLLVVVLVRTDWSTCCQLMSLRMYELLRISLLHELLEVLRHNTVSHILQVSLWRVAPPPLAKTSN